VCRPRIPGHEVVGVVVSVGPGAKRFKVGDRVGRGWAGGYCFECKACRTGNFVACSQHITTGLNQDGGWAEYMAARWESLAQVPSGMPAEQAGPLMCAGVTVFNSIRRAGLKAGGWLAVQGIGGLGHLAVQFARAMGYRVVVLSTSADKEKFAKDLGAHEYIDASKGDTVAALMQLTGGYGVELIVSTSPSGKAMQSVINALGPNGKLLVLGAGPDPISAFPGQLIGNNRCIQVSTRRGEPTAEAARRCVTPAMLLLLLTCHRISCLLVVFVLLCSLSFLLSLSLRACSSWTRSSRAAPRPSTRAAICPAQHITVSSCSLLVVLLPLLSCKLHRLCVFDSFIVGTPLESAAAALSIRTARASTEAQNHDIC
jgi:D-arabinose 1-dehydrogenase-like Zn-dependent alcohol dehydrogenase